MDEFMLALGWYWFWGIKFSLQTHKYAEDVKKKKEQYEHYNILPLYAVGAKPAIMEHPEVACLGVVFLFMFACAN